MYMFDSSHIFSDHLQRSNRQSVLCQTEGLHIPGLYVPSCVPLLQKVLSKGEKKTTDCKSLFLSGLKPFSKPLYFSGICSHFRPCKSCKSHFADTLFKGIFTSQPPLTDGADCKQNLGKPIFYLLTFMS